MTWLIVEDEEDIRNILALMVNYWGHTALVFPDSTAAIRWLQDVIAGVYTDPLPSLALVDIRLPGLSGDLLAERMRQVKALDAMAIVMMTAFSLTESERRQIITRTGADDLIWKPLPDLNELRVTLHAIVDQRASQRETAWKVGCD